MPTGIPLKYLVKICATCGDPFATYSNQKKVCDECDLSMSIVKYAHDNFICVTCGKGFHRKAMRTHCLDCLSKNNLCACGCGLLVRPLSRFKKGHARRGGKNSVNHNLAIMKANKGRIAPKETREKMSRAQTGLKRTEECRLKQSLMAKERGFGKWMLGKNIPKESVAKRIATMKKNGFKHSDDAKMKISLKNRGFGNGMFGHKFTPDELKKWSETSKNNWKMPGYYDKWIKTKVARGTIKDPKCKNKYDAWEIRVDRISNANYRNSGMTIKRNRQWHLDHILSKNDGFRLNVSPCIMGHICNLKVIPSIDNLSKNYRSKQSLDELIGKILIHFRGINESIS